MFDELANQKWYLPHGESYCFAGAMPERDMSEAFEGEDPPLLPVK